MPRDLVPGRVRPPARERRAPAARSSNGHCAAHDEDRRDPHGMWMVVVRSGGSSRRQATGTLFGVGSAPLLSFSPPLCFINRQQRSSADLSFDPILENHDDA
jgi:hypothetical protein